MPVWSPLWKSTRILPTRIASSPTTSISRKRGKRMFNQKPVHHVRGGHHPTIPWTEPQQKLLDLLGKEENRQLTVRTLCQKAGVSRDIWYQAVKDPQFAASVQALGRQISRRADAHIQVTLTSNPEEELAKDIWDIRRLKSDYPKHRDPNEFKVDFTWIANPCLRQQVKDYFRRHLPKWKSKTFSSYLGNMKIFLRLLPPEIHMGTIDRKQVEQLLPKVYLFSNNAVCRCLQTVKAMFTYMATSPAWTGPRPPRGLIWDEDIPHKPSMLPRPVPPDILDQFDVLMERAVEAMKAEQEPPILSPIMWDALIVLRRTGMRAEDLAHLRA